MSPRGANSEPGADAAEALGTYVVGAVNDHIVPWASSYRATGLLGGDVKYVLSNGGHIAGIVNPPSARAWYQAIDGDAASPGGQARRAAADGQPALPGDRGCAGQLRAWLSRKPRNRLLDMAAMSLRLDNDHLATPEMDRLRARAEDLSIAGDWAGLHALRPELEKDAECWPDLWGPLCAIAAQKQGDPAAVDLLARLADGGFCQPELFEGELEAAFAADPRWPQIMDRMALNVPARPLELTEWPVLTPAAPLGLLDLPGRAGELRALVPAPVAGAWPTAQNTLKWVSHRWKHANAHMEIDDTVECLRRVDEGQRFACVEYSLVLSQALNAIGIPARRLWLRQEHYQVGLGRGHVVSEAWIDDLNRWIVLDGQNGLYWIGADGSPLGAVGLQEAVRAGASCPSFVTFRDDFEERSAPGWFSYFAHVSSNAGTWPAGPFGLVFQRDRLVTSHRLEHDPGVLYPDLSQVGIETALDGGRPALRLSTAHPYATGFAVDGAELDGDLLVLDTSAGGHEHQVAARTGYGILAGRPLRYRVAG
jgi:hypothetical protein